MLLNGPVGQPKCARFSLTEGKTEGRKKYKQATTESCWSKGMAKHLKDWEPHSVMSVSSRFKEVNVFFISDKNDAHFYNYVRLLV